MHEYVSQEVGVTHPTTFHLGPELAVFKSQFFYVNDERKLKATNSQSWIVGTDCLGLIQFRPSLIQPTY